MRDENVRSGRLVKVDNPFEFRVAAFLVLPPRVAGRSIGTVDRDGTADEEDEELKNAYLTCPPIRIKSSMVRGLNTK